MPTLNKISVDNVVYDIGSNALVVTLEEEGETVIASHTPTQIKNALDSGTPAYLSLAGMLDNSGLVPFVQASASVAIAPMAFSNGTAEIGVVTFFIDDNKEATSVELACVSTTGDQTISGVKTFNTLPQSSGTPTSNNQLVNKQYVDSHDYNITSGTADPSGGSDGDIYLKYEA